MRTPQMRMSPVQQKVVLFTGGVNEEINSIQLKAGELFSCINYQEVGGQYSGYSSVPGYERFDGQTAPSSVPVLTYADNGLDSNVALLLEADLGTTIADKSASSNVLTTVGAVVSADKFKLNNASLYFDGASSITTPASAALNPSRDFCIEFDIYYASRLGTFGIFHKDNSLDISLVDGYVTVAGSTDGITTDINLVSDTFVAGDAAWQHIAVVLEGTTLSIYFDGVAQTTTATVPGYPIDNANDIVLGSGLLGYIDELRLSFGAFRYPIDFTPPVKPFSFNDFYVEYVDDAAREAARLAIAVVPGEGAPLGVVYYNDTVYAFRNDTPAGIIAKMYKSSASGWVEVVQPVGYEFKTNGVFKFSIYRFEGYNNNQPLLVITDGVSIPRVFDGTTITVLTSSELPDNQAVSPKFASLSGAYNNRLYLGYKEGSLLFSNIGNPTTFSSIIGGSGELFLGDELTNIVEAPGNALILTCRNFIKILKDVDQATTYDWSVMLETFTERNGAIANTAQALLGDVYFADDEGVTSLAATDTFGDFSTAIISNKVKKSFLSGKSLITASMVDRSNNQYRLYLSDGTIFYFTFEAKKVKGVTKVIYPIPVLSVTKGEDSIGTVRKFFASTSGNIYEMDSGTSFDGAIISTLLLTAYHSYGSPRLWKNFKRLVLEISADKGLPLAYRTVFDYSEPQYPKTLLSEYMTKGVSGIWGQDAWGSFSWGANSVQRLVLYLRGSGANMGIELRSSSKYKSPHILHNGIVDFTVGSRQL